MADELAAFVLARLQEDEADALAAATCVPDYGTRWDAVLSNSADPAYGYRVVRTSRHGVHRSVAGSLPSAVADYMASQDPAATLARVEALRALVAHYANAAAWADDPSCPECQRQMYRYVAGGLLDALRHLAAIWRDHPDYRAGEWAP